MKRFILNAEDCVYYEDNLTLCPFCGGATQTVHGVRITSGWRWSVECNGCHMETGAQTTEHGALQAWERRFAKDDIEDDGYITWKRYRQRFCDEFTERIESR